MTRGPPKSNRKETHFPCTTLFRSRQGGLDPLTGRAAQEQASRARLRQAIEDAERRLARLNGRIEEITAEEARLSERTEAVAETESANSEVEARQLAIEEARELLEIGRASCRERVCQYV